LAFDTFAQLRKYFDGTGGFVLGHQIVTIRSSRRKIPEWTRDDQFVRKLIRKSFPKMDTDPKQRFQAGRWAAVIHLFYRLQLPTGQIAADMGVKVKKVRDVLQRLRRAAKGLSTDGTGRKLGGNRGRPKVR